MNGNISHRKSIWAGLVLAATALLASLFMLSGSAMAATQPDNNVLNGGTFGAVPTITAKYPARSYFSYNLSPGQSIKDDVLLSNGKTKPVTLKLSPSMGETANNSGYFYANAFKKVTGPATWITGLPKTVTIPARVGKKPRQIEVGFTVHVPAGTPAKQYLAGITIAPNSKPKSTKIGQKGKVSVGAIILHQVNIGLAVTVGKLSTLPKKLDIQSVRAILFQNTLPRILIREYNAGKTFLVGKGTSVCTDRGVKHFNVESGIILPEQAATLTINGQGLPLGTTAYCVNTIDFSGTAPVVFKGNVHIPGGNPNTKVVHTGNGQYTTINTSKSHTLLYVIIGAAVVIVILLLLMLLLLGRRRRDDDDKKQAPVVVTPPNNQDHS